LPLGAFKGSNISTSYSKAKWKKNIVFAIVEVWTIVKLPMLAMGVSKIA